jgi:hypothetical protein
MVHFDPEGPRTWNSPEALSKVAFMWREGRIWWFHLVKVIRDKENVCGHVSRPVGTTSSHAVGYIYVTLQRRPEVRTRESPATNNKLCFLADSVISANSHASRRPCLHVALEQRWRCGLHSIFWRFAALARLSCGTPLSVGNRS